MEVLSKPGRQTSVSVTGDSGRGPRSRGAADLNREPRGRGQVRHGRHQDHAAEAPVQDELCVTTHAVTLKAQRCFSKVLIVLVLRERVKSADTEAKQQSNTRSR